MFDIKILQSRRVVALLFNGLGNRGQTQGRGILFQAFEGQLLGQVLALLFHNTCALNEHPTGTTSR